MSFLNFAKVQIGNTDSFETCIKLLFRLCGIDCCP